MNHCVSTKRVHDVAVKNEDQYLCIGTKWPPVTPNENFKEVEIGIHIYKDLLIFIKKNKHWNRNKR